MNEKFKIEGDGALGFKDQPTPAEKLFRSTHGTVTESHEVKLRGWRWMVAFSRRQPRRYMVIDKIDWDR